MNDIKAGITYLLGKASLDPRIRDLAVSITGRNNNPIADVHAWTKANIKYISDPIAASGGDIELFISPVKMIQDFSDGKPLGGDCDDQAIMNTALFRSLGMNAHVVLLDTGGAGIDHAVCEVYSSALGRYLTVDTTINNPVGWEEKYTNKIIV